MEEYLPRCLDSVVDTQYIDDIEIIVVNDGSKDKSSEIAHSYKSKFPQSVVVIDKENGNYGSTINAALPVVTGKYVKVLDADDWFDRKALCIYIDKLINIDADLIITPFTLKYIDGHSINVEHFMDGKENIVYDLSIFFKRNTCIDMHAITYRLSMLINNDYKQTEGISYTDTEWAIYPMVYVKTVQFISANIYQYFLGRDGQTVSLSYKSNNQIKHLSIIYCKIIERLNFDNNNIPMHYIINRIVRSLRRDVYSVLPLMLPNSKELVEIEDLENRLITVPVLYERTNNITIKRYLCFKFLKSWRKNNRSWNIVARSYIQFMNLLRDCYTTLRQLKLFSNH